MTQFTVGLDITLDNCHTGTYSAWHSFFFTEFVPILNVERIIFTFAPCMLLHLSYLKPAHALFVKYTHIHI